MQTSHYGDKKCLQFWQDAPKNGEKRSLWWTSWPHQAFQEQEVTQRESLPSSYRSWNCTAAGSRTYFSTSAGPFEALFTDAGASSEKTEQRLTGRMLTPERRLASLFEVGEPLSFCFFASPKPIGWRKSSWKSIFKIFLVARWLQCSISSPNIFFCVNQCWQGLNFSAFLNSVLSGLDVRNKTPVKSLFQLLLQAF